MRSMIELDDELACLAQAHAERTGRTLDAVVAEALRRVLPGPAPSLPALSGTGGLMPGIDLSDNSSVRDVMDDPAA